MALPSQQELLLLLSEAAPIQLWTALPNGELDWVNQATCEYFGRTCEELVGEGWQNVVHQADLKKSVKSWMHSLDTGEPYRREFRLQRASDGLYRWHLSHAVPVANDDGTIRKWIGSNTDIDDQKRAMEVYDAAKTIAEMERQRLQQIIRHAPTVMSVYRGPEFEIALVNTAWERFTGRTNAVGKKVAELFPEMEQQGILDILKKVYGTGEPYRTDEMRLVIDRNGDLEETFWEFSLIRLEEKQEFGYDILAHAVEVTDRVRRREELIGD